MGFQSLVLIVIVLLVSTATNHAIPVDINDPHVIKVATFAVTEYNKHNTEANLIFEKVINGVSDVTENGTNYRLTLSANDGSTSNNFSAIVLENPADNFTLTAFALIPHA
ncbi:putative Cystatin domain-containing protein [Medicago truncatula]|uniref:Putative Cystatin domain-containing protein n=1 Tax=Medicago truncatula TaxID=3880 RepID=A0A396JSI7_MEDTR|nr:putative Cystatin domain-containing protein [Medicago truncatula]